ncbi:MAG: hypothetical protein PUP46_03525 [Endozoicomonas sp. (ex Botrylloides leachii)]|nr:hypothetical protein [Endozoicomonas sp. (ex Botrylloides leachii)]
MSQKITNLLLKASALALPLALLAPQASATPITDQTAIEPEVTKIHHTTASWDSTKPRLMCYMDLFNEW